MVRYAILGSIELCEGERRVAVRGPRLVALLALLLVNANRAVSNDRLIDALWGDLGAGGAVVKRLQAAIVRLRRTLDGGGGGESVLRTVAGGYVLAVRTGELDADVFQARLQSGQRALEAGEAARARDVLGEALGLWRGPALADVAYEEFAQPEIRRLEELRLAALEARVDCELRLGEHGRVIAELEALVAAYPERERLTGQLMLALYRGGRQGDALEAYARVRSYLSGQLGLEPGPALQTLQGEILAQSSTLELAADAAETPIVTRGASPESIRLPPRRIALLGRETATEALVDLLRRRDVRLVTVMGVGGVGKTSLAIEVAYRLAAELSDGAAFVDLAALADPARLADTVLHALGGTPEPGTSATETLSRMAAGREQLLVLDNFEHLLAGAPLLANLLDVAPRLKLLVTSRAAVELCDERRYPLIPLALPDVHEPAAVSAAPATALFIARALARDPAFELTLGSAQAISTVCARLDGLPLAIELAAARTSTLSAQEIAHRLGRVLLTLGPGDRDTPARQRTLRATLDWSYELLDESERAAFAQLAVFAGGCTIDAAERVTAVSLEVLEGLIANSMLTRRVSVDGQTRLAMLETVREYAAQRLANRADAAVTAERHSRYYSGLAATAAPGLLGPDQRAWQRRLDAEADNFRDALEHDERDGNAERVLRLAIALERWWQRGRGSAGRAWIQAALAVQTDLPVKLRADALRVVAVLCGDLADLAHGLSCARQALELYETIDDCSGQSLALIELAMLSRELNDAQAAEASAARAVRLADNLGAWALGMALIAQAVTARDPVAAKPIVEQAAQLLQEVGDAHAQAWLFGNLGYIALEHGAIDDAHELIERALEFSEQIDDRVSSTYDLANLALCALEPPRGGGGALR